MLTMRSRPPAIEPEPTASREPPSPPPPVVHAEPAPAANPAYTEQMRARRALLVEHMSSQMADSEAIRTGMQVDEATRQRVLRLAEDACTMKGLAMDEPARAALLGQVIDEFCGFGPIQALLDDPSVSEIMVNGPLHVYVERHGKSLLMFRAFR